MNSLVFQIGQNKTGTLSISHLLGAAGFEVARWDGEITRRMWQNLGARRPLLEGLERWNAFTDMDPAVEVQAQMWRDDGPRWEEHAGWALFREMHEAYPEAHFVFNHRPRPSWERSVAHHYRELFAGEPEKLRAYVARRSRARDAHADAVREYFAHHPEARFVEIEIEEPNAGAKLCRFLGLGSDMAEHWLHLNKSG